MPPKAITKSLQAVAIFLSFFSISVIAQTGNIVGKITDEGNSKMVVGATVTILEQKLNYKRVRYLESNYQKIKSLW